jgi:hypothetical protein
MTGLQRLGWIVAWWIEIMEEQVDPGRFRLFVPPALWPGWDWAQVNATTSHAKRPWAEYAYRWWGDKHGEDDCYFPSDDYFDDDDF